MSPMYAALIFSGQFSTRPSVLRVMRVMSPVLLNRARKLQVLQDSAPLRHYWRCAQGGTCTICAVTLWQMKIVHHGIHAQSIYGVLRIAMDERQRKSRYPWGSMQESGFACKIALCNCGKYMRASSVEVPTVYLAYSWLSRRPDIGCKT